MRVSLAWTWTIRWPNSRTHADVVDVLPDQVRRVEVQAQVRARELLEQRRHTAGDDGQVLAARPLVAP